ncbi:MAG: hypothetical protein RLZ61_1252 [Planctomycetota bacterium]
MVTDQLTFYSEKIYNFFDNAFVILGRAKSALCYIK